MEELPLLLDDGCAALQWAEAPLPDKQDLAGALWAPDAAPGVNELRDAMCDSPNGQTLAAYEAVWFGVVTPRVRASPWVAQLGSVWRPSSASQRLWVSCPRFESIMLARLHASFALAPARARPILAVENEAAYEEAAACYEFAALEAAGWANAPPGFPPELSARENDACARLARALAAACGLSPEDAPAWRGVAALCAWQGDAGIRPCGLALRRTGLAAHGQACAAAAAAAAAENRYADAVALQARAVEDAQAAGTSAKTVEKLERRLATLRFALAKVFPGSQSSFFADAMLPAATPAPSISATYPPPGRT